MFCRFILPLTMIKGIERETFKKLSYKEREKNKNADFLRK